ncbi:unnamed protein product [Soboliphyme baturini]|uniref:DNA polymerase alpha subunit B N-terminal domain-containing protein n=1 Tax=Soboliphyme baturini TaxID=241478 RepID=A0A183J7Y2_9BILA|nr:unnamed protein product [Soboliphyme baturini]
MYTIDKEEFIAQLHMFSFSVAEDDQILWDKITEISHKYGLNAEDFSNAWIAFASSYNFDELNQVSLIQLEKNLQRRRAVQPKPKTGKSSLASTDLLLDDDEVEMPEEETSEFLAQYGVLDVSI